MLSRQVSSLLMRQSRGHSSCIRTKKEEDFPLDQDILSALDLEYHYPGLTNFGLLNSSVGKYQLLRSQVEEVEEWLTNIESKNSVATTKPMLEQLGNTPLADIIDATPSDDMLKNKSVFDIVKGYRDSLVSDLAKQKMIVEDNHKQLMWDILDQNIVNQRGISRVVEGYPPYDFSFIIKDRRLNQCLFHLHNNEFSRVVEEYTDEEVQWCLSNLEEIKNVGWTEWVTFLIKERGIEEPAHRYYEPSDDEPLSNLNHFDFMFKR